MAILDVFKLAKTDGFKVPAGTSAQRPTEAFSVRANTDYGYLEFSMDGVNYVAVGQGATGGGTDAAFVENDHYVTTDYTIGQNSMVLCTFDETNDLVLWTGHGVTAGQMVFFKTTGTLPAILADHGYYVIAIGLTANAFAISDTLGGSAKNLVGAIGTHSVGKIKNAKAVNMTIKDGVTVTIPTGAVLEV